MTATFDVSPPLPLITTTLPAEGEEFTSCSYYSPPIFQWDTDDTFSKIELQFSTDISFTTMSRIKTVIGINQVTIPSSKWKKMLLIPGTGGGRIYWRVAGTKIDKSIIYSNTSSFIVKALDPVSNMDISPTSKSTLPTISWENNCAKTFRVWFSSTSDITMKPLSRSVISPLDNSGNFSQALTATEWLSIRSLVWRYNRGHNQLVR